MEAPWRRSRPWQSDLAPAPYTATRAERPAAGFYTKALSHPILNPGCAATAVPEPDLPWSAGRDRHPDGAILPPPQNRREPQWSERRRSAPRGYRSEYRQT